MHHAEIQAGEEMAAKLERQISEPMADAYNEIARESVRVRDEEFIDLVQSPPHYNQGAVECIEAIEAALTADEFRGYCKGNALKYIWRERHKGGDESIRKALWYLERALTDG